MDKKTKSIVQVTRKSSGTDDLSTFFQNAVEVITCTDLNEIEPFDIDLISGVFISHDFGIQESARLTRQLRLKWGNRYRPIVWITESFTSEQKAEAYRSGADACWTVPLDQADQRAQWEAFKCRGVISDEISSVLLERQEDAKTVRVLHERRQSELQLAQHILALTTSPPPSEIGPFRISMSQQVNADRKTRIESFPLANGVRIVISEMSSLNNWAELLTALVIREWARTPLACRDVLKQINQSLRDRQSELLPAAMAILDLVPEISELELSQAGFRSPSITRVGDAQEQPRFPECLLGIYEIEYRSLRSQFDAGDLITIMTDGPHPPRISLVIECTSEKRIHLP